MRTLAFLLLLFAISTCYAEDVGILPDSERNITCDCKGASAECGAAVGGGIWEEGYRPVCVQTTNPVIEGCYVMMYGYPGKNGGAHLQTYECIADEKCPLGYWPGTCDAVLADPQMKDSIDKAIANNNGQLVCRDWVLPSGNTSCAYIQGFPAPTTSDTGSSGGAGTFEPLKCPYDPVTQQPLMPNFCKGSIAGTSYSYQCCQLPGEDCCARGDPPVGCPQGWGGGGCGSRDNCIEITSGTPGPDGQSLKCSLDVNPECPKGSCEPPGGDSPIGSDSGSSSDSPTSGSGTDSPTGGSGSDSPTGGGGGTFPGGIPADSGGGSSGSSDSGSGTGTGSAGKDADKDGNCAPGYIPSKDVKKENETYCRPAGTTEPNADGKCPDGWEFSEADSRFCVKKSAIECPEGQFYEVGTGCKNNGDPCPKGRVQESATKECIIQIEVTDSAGPAKPGAITIFDICKQPKAFLSAEVQAQCAIQDAKTKEAQLKKDAEYLEGLVTGFKDFIKSDVKELAVEKMDISKLYSGVLAPFESFFKDSPECPFNDIEIPVIDVFGRPLDLSDAFKGENNKLACDVFAAVRIIFLLGVYYLGFRLIFKALTGV